jgi:ribosomal protein L19E
MVSAVASGVGQVRGQKMAKLQHSQKFMEKVHAAVVRQTRMITGDSNISRRIWHFTNA